MRPAKVAAGLIGWMVLVSSCDAPTSATDGGAVVDGQPGDGQPESDAASGTDGAIDSTPLPSPLPIMIAAANYLELRDQLLDLGPFMVYAWATDPALENPYRYDQELGYLAAIDDPGVSELIMFSSYRTAGEKLEQPGHLDYLRSIGVTGLGFNSEGAMTPADEMNSLGDSNPATNAVARFAQIAAAAELEILWGPIRVTADAVSDDAVATMVGAGLDGVGLQEQQFIEAACVEARVAAVTGTAARYRTVAGQLGASTHVDVQIMPSRCLTGDLYGAANCGESGGVEFGHCAEFVAEITGAVDSIAIWASGPSDRADLVPLIVKLRE